MDEEAERLQKGEEPPEEPPVEPVVEKPPMSLFESIFNQDEEDDV